VCVYKGWAVFFCSFPETSKVCLSVRQASFVVTARVTHHKPRRRERDSGRNAQCHKALSLLFFLPSMTVAQHREKGNDLLWRGITLKEISFLSPMFYPSRFPEHPLVEAEPVGNVNMFLCTFLSLPDDFSWFWFFVDNSFKENVFNSISDSQWPLRMVLNISQRFHQGKRFIVPCLHQLRQRHPVELELSSNNNNSSSKFKWTR
jgi:hypothetical protein